jgi:hypothetical protein
MARVAPGVEGAVGGEGGEVGCAGGYLCGFFWEGEGGWEREGGRGEGEGEGELSADACCVWGALVGVAGMEVGMGERTARPKIGDRHEPEKLDEIKSGNINGISTHQ